MHKANHTRLFDRNRSSVLAILLMSCTTNVFSGEMGSPSNFNKNLIIQGGVFWPHQGATQTINVSNLVGEEYTLTNKSQENGLVGLGYYLNGFEITGFDWLMDLMPFI